jgi:predicted hydrocarbon binding protein
MSRAPFKIWGNSCKKVSCSVAEQSTHIGAQSSGMYYPNRIARSYFLALEEVMGKHGLEATLEIAGLNGFVGTLPTDTLERTVDFAVLSALNLALDEMYGARGGRGMALRAGRAWLVKGMNGFGALSGVGDPAFRALSVEERVRISLRALASVFTHFSDQRSSFEETAQAFRFNVENSPTAWMRESDKPVCHPLVGLLQETVRWAANGRDYAVREVECGACGRSSSCIFLVNKHPL